MKEDELRQELYETLSEEFSGGLKKPPKVMEVPENSNQKSYVCHLQLASFSNRLAAQFFFEKKFGAGYLPREYRVASYADRPIPSTVIATSYPKGGLREKFGGRKYVFLPVYSTNVKQFDSNRFYEEKTGWYPLIEALNNDGDIASWFKNMPLYTSAGNRRLEMDFGSSRNYLACFGQLAPSPTKDNRNITAIGFRAIPKWEKKMFALGSGLGRGVKGVDISYMSDLVKIIGRICERIYKLDFRGEVDNGALASINLFKLTGEALD